MNCNDVGKLIYKLRTENGMTQMQLAEVLNISDKAISKWERGLGCPDVSLLKELSDIFKVNTESILTGDMQLRPKTNGNISKVRFFLCRECHSISACFGNSEISCCGRKLLPLKPNTPDESHIITSEIIEDDYYITFNHDMEKSHYIMFAAYVMLDKVMIFKLYPEQQPELRFPKIAGGDFYYYCSNHGFFKAEI